jgi:hypothetical protein
MATLKELMGDLTRGDGRKFITNNAWFEPIFLDQYENWYGLDNNEHGVDFCAYSIDTWEPYMEPELNNWKDLIAEKELSALRKIAAVLKKAREEEYCNVPQYVDEAINNFEAVAIVKLWSEK